MLKLLKITISELFQLLKNNEKALANIVQDRRRWILKFRPIIDICYNGWNRCGSNCKFPCTPLVGDVGIICHSACFI